MKNLSLFKRIAVLTLALVLLLGTAACGTPAETEAVEGSETDSTNVDAEESPTAEEAEADIAAFIEAEGGYNETYYNIAERYGSVLVNFSESYASGEAYEYTIYTAGENVVIDYGEDGVQMLYDGQIYEITSPEDEDVYTLQLFYQEDIIQKEEFFNTGFLFGDEDYDIHLVSEADGSYTWTSTFGCSTDLEEDGYATAVVKLNQDYEVTETSISFYYPDGSVYCEETAAYTPGAEEPEAIAQLEEALAATEGDVRHITIHEVTNGQVTENGWECDIPAGFNCGISFPDSFYDEEGNAPLYTDAALTEVAGEPDLYADAEYYVKVDKTIATYLGVKDYQTATREDVLTDANAVYEFDIDGETRDLCVACDEDFSLQNQLMIGSEYYLELSGDMVTGVTLVDDSEIQGVVEGYTPGERSVKNFLAAGMAPMGSTLYIYGGGWNFQDDGASPAARRIGLSPRWESFYLSQDESYNYKDYYPDNAWNVYNYEGLDCTGFVGWAIYNTLYTESETEEGFVGGVFTTLSEDLGLGSFTHPTDWSYEEIFDALKPGDIIGTPEHVYIVLGKCDDGSFVVLHSTVTESVSGVKGGGVQLSAVSIHGDDDTDCEAYALAKETMESYYPEWTAKYPVVLKPVSSYFDIGEEESWIGIFSWNIGEDGLTDEEGVRDMSAEEILDLLLN